MGVSPKDTGGGTGSASSAYFTGGSVEDQTLLLPCGLHESLFSQLANYQSAGSECSPVFLRDTHVWPQKKKRYTKCTGASGRNLTLQCWIPYALWREIGGGAQCLSCVNGWFGLERDKEKMWFQSCNDSQNYTTVYMQQMLEAEWLLRCDALKEFDKWTIQGMGPNILKKQNSGQTHQHPVHFSTEILKRWHI